jgi:hypothetical protein
VTVHIEKQPHWPISRLHRARGSEAASKFQGPLTFALSACPKQRLDSRRSSFGSGTCISAIRLSLRPGVSDLIFRFPCLGSGCLCSCYTIPDLWRNHLALNSLEAEQDLLTATFLQSQLHRIKPDFSYSISVLRACEIAYFGSPCSRSPPLETCGPSPPLYYLASPNGPSSEFETVLEGGAIVLSFHIHNDHLGLECDFTIYGLKVSRAAWRVAHYTKYMVQISLVYPISRNEGLTSGILPLPTDPADGKLCQHLVLTETVTTLLYSRQVVCILYLFVSSLFLISQETLFPRPPPSNQA